jgi:hypothetical protein
MAKKFLYVCLGAALSVGGFSVGAVGGRAHSSAVFEIGDFEQNGSLVLAVSGRALSYAAVDPSVQTLGPTVTLPSVPGGASIISVGSLYPIGTFVATLSDGSVYGIGVGDGAWVLLGSLGSGPVPSVSTSWGAVKTRYR